jgi:hypothetical protein
VPPEVVGREVAVEANEGIGTWKGDLRAPGVLMPTSTGGNVLFPTLDTLSGVGRNPGVP